MRGKLIEQITALFFQFGFHYCNIVFFERWVGRARNSQGQGIRKVLNQQSRSTTFIWKRKGTLKFLPIKIRLSLKMDFRAQLRPVVLTLGNERVNECIIQIRTYIVLQSRYKLGSYRGPWKWNGQESFTVFFLSKVFSILPAQTAETGHCYLS